MGPEQSPGSGARFRSHVPDGPHGHDARGGGIRELDSNCSLSSVNTSVSVYVLRFTAFGNIVIKIGKL